MNNKMWMILVCVVALVTPVWADAPALDFENHSTLGLAPVGGTLNWYRLDFQADLSVCPSPICAIATGEQIPMVTLEAEGTPANEGEYPLINMTNLQFTTGPYIETVDGVMHFGAGGQLRIYGTLADNDSPAIIAGPSLLLNGVFNSASYEPLLGLWSLFTADGTDSKNQDIVDYFYPVVPPLGWQFEAEIMAQGGVGHTLSSGGLQVYDAEVANTEVPEPASIVFLGTALLGLATVVRRRWA